MLREREEAVEPKRALFTREVTALIKKFEDWKEEEKRQKERKKQEMREVEEREVDDGEDGVEPESLNQENSPPPASNFDGSADYTSHEVDALAAQQLHQETTFTASGPKKKTEPDTTIPALSTPPPAYKPFKSFYSKRHLRDAAVAGHRRGRAITAFGEPVPELDDHEFELPPTILTEDAVRASSRRKRRQREKEFGWVDYCIYQGLKQVYAINMAFGKTWFYSCIASASWIFFSLYI